MSPNYCEEVFKMDILKFLHVASVFFWISCLLVVTRELAWRGRKEASTYKKLYFRVELPFMCLTVLTGLLLLFMKDVDWKAPWIHMKLTFVALLIICDLILLAQLMKPKREGAEERLLAYKILHWVAVFSLLVVLMAIYVMKPKFL